MKNGNMCAMKSGPRRAVLALLLATASGVADAQGNVVNLVCDGGRVTLATGDMRDQQGKPLPTTTVLIDLSAKTADGQPAKIDERSVKETLHKSPDCALWR